MTATDSTKTAADPMMDSGREDRVYRVLVQAGLALGISMERSDFDFAALSKSADEITHLVDAGRQVGITLKPTSTRDSQALFDLVAERFPVILALSDGRYFVLQRSLAHGIEVSQIGEMVTSVRWFRRDLRRQLRGDPKAIVFIAKEELQCAPISSGDHGDSDSGHDDDHHHHHSPIRRYFRLLRMDGRDIIMVALFAFVAGVLSLATPLAIESLVNVVSWGTYLQPLVVLGIMLLACLGLSGVLQVLQTVVVEIIQRRQMVRLVGDLSHRFGQANQASLHDVYPRELANRLFDIVTIQKSTAALLLDGITIVLTAILGMFLLAFYHPFLLGFDIVLLLSMVLITWILGRGGIRTAINESIAKYEIFHWLQDVLALPTAFKINGGQYLAVDRTNRLAVDYLDSRHLQFRVILRQVIFAVSVQTIALTALLCLGGWLVINQQLTLGQLVASELVVTVVVGAFAKAGKTFEKYYDVMAGVDKVGHLLDIPIDSHRELGDLAGGPASIRWGGVKFAESPATKVEPVTVQAGRAVAICGDDVDGRSLLMRSLAGLSRPAGGGQVEINDIDAALAAREGGGQVVGYAGDAEIFHGSIRQNIDLGRSSVSRNRVREVLQDLGLWSDVMRLPNGLATPLLTGGEPLLPSQRAKLMLARAMAGRPRVLLVDSVLDCLAGEDRKQVWSAIASPDRPWTLVVSTSHAEIAQWCDERVFLRRTSQESGQ
ncbi:ATP-binding cassette domain-containing protein [Crateriforma spongiae]|uniref:ATP-binding cassette domain-containing protein n=1 Tax=Crateriforma spongiae TaxID=2724528 RepID=UPI0039AFF892